MTRFREARDHLGEAANSIVFARSALEDMQKSPIQAIDLHRRWREYLVNWSRAWDFIRQAAQKCPERQLSDSMKNRHEKNRVAQYLYHARNSDIHVGPVVDPTPSSLNIGGVISINSDNIKKIVVQRNYTIDPAGVAHPLPEFVGSIERGDVKGQMVQPEKIEIIRAYLKLLPATDKSGTYAVPRIDGPEENRAVTVALAGLDFLEAAHKEVADSLDKCE